MLKYQPVKAMSRMNRVKLMNHGPISRRAPQSFRSFGLQVFGPTVWPAFWEHQLAPPCFSSKRFAEGGGSADATAADMETSVSGGEEKKVEFEPSEITYV